MYYQTLNVYLITCIKHIRTNHKFLNDLICFWFLWSLFGKICSNVWPPTKWSLTDLCYDLKAKKRWRLWKLKKGIKFKKICVFITFNLNFYGLCQPTVQYKPTMQWRIKTCPTANITHILSTICRNTLWPLF